MGFRDRLRGRILAEIAENEAAAQYSGEPYPDGTYGACGFGQELVVRLPPGKVKAVYYARGRPSTYSASSNNWTLPAISWECKPADAQTPRLAGAREPRMASQSVNSLGWSHKTWMILEVLEPGGQYLVKIPGPVFDDQSHVRFVS